jgi:hypothetical protein
VRLFDGPALGLCDGLRHARGDGDGARALGGERVAVVGWQWDRWKEEVKAVRMVVVRGIGWQY